MKILGLGIPELPILAAIVIPIAIIVIVVKKRTKKSEQHREEAAAQAAYQTGTIAMPAVEGWKPSPGFSVLGALVNSTLFAFVSAMITSVFVAFAGYLAGLFISLILWPGIPIVYALVVYPSYFTDKPLIKSSRAISFLNYTIGWVIFGALWNSNLRCSNLERRPKKGYSHIVFTVIAAICLCFSAISGL